MTTQKRDAAGLGMSILEQMLEPYHQFSTPTQRAERRDEIAAAGAEVNAATRTATSDAQQVVSDNVNRRRSAEAVFDDMDSALVALNTANQERNSVLAKASKMEAEKNSRAVEVYNEQVNSDTARNRFRQASANFNERVDRLNQLEQQSQTGNMLQRFVVGMRRQSAMQRVQETQYALDGLNRQRLMATEQFAAALSDNRNLARAAVAQDLVVHESRAQAAASQIEHYTRTRENLSSLVAGLSETYGLDRAATSSLQTRLKALQDQEIYDEGIITSSLQSAYTKMQMEQMELSLERARNNKEALAAQEPVWQAYIESTGARDQIGDMTFAQFAALSTEDRNLLGFYPEYAMFASGTMRQVVTPYSTARERMMSGVPLTPADEANMALGARLVDNYNGAIREQFMANLSSDERKMAENPETDIGRRLAAQLLDLQNPNDWPAINNEMNKYFRNMHNDVTMMFDSGAVEYGNFADHMTDPTFQEMFTSNVPEDILEFMRDGEFEKIDTRMRSYQDAQRIRQESVAHLVDQHTTTLPTGQRQTDWASVERNIEPMSKFLAGNFKTQREVVQRMQYPMLSNTQVRLPGSRGNGSQLVDLENPGAVHIMLREELISRRTQQAATQRETRTLEQFVGPRGSQIPRG